VDDAEAMPSIAGAASALLPAGAVELVAKALETSARLEAGAVLPSCMAAELKSVAEGIGAMPCGFLAQ